MTTSTRERFVGFREEYFSAILEVVDQVVAEADLDGTSTAKMLAYQMETGGKRLRAILPLMVADALGKSPQKLVPFGAACELIHNATLVHDDLQDGDRVRRDQPTAWVEFGTERAINLGDAILYLAPLCLDQLDQIDADPKTRWKVAAETFRLVLQVIEGQEQEFALEYSSATQADYDRMVNGKTSGLFSLPMAGAARLCGADEALITGLKEASKHLGVLFQIQDDVVDLYGNKGRDARGADIREGKISALVVSFVERAPSTEVERLGKILAADRNATDSEDVQWAIEAFRRHGALDAVLAEIDKRHRRALSVEILQGYAQLQGLIDGFVDLFLEPIEALI